MKLAWLLVLVALGGACGGEGGSGGDTSGTGSGASSSGGTSTGGTATSGGAPSTGGTTTSGGGSSSGATGGGGSGGVDAGPVIPGGPCTEPIATPPSPPCKQGQPKQSYCRTASPSALVMATCESYGETQCEAASACGAGWHFCTGTEYLDRGGRTVPKADGVIYAWIAACVRDATGNTYHDGPCSVCDSNVGAPPGMIYGCSGESISPGMIDDTIGATADTTCHRIGDNVPATAGFWSINWSGHLSGHTLCCIDGA